MTEDAGGLPLPIDGAARVFAILGDPIRQVQSPTEFNRLLRRLGFAGVLVPLHVSPEDLAAAVEGIRRMANFDGFIITVPHKIAMLDLVDEVLANGARVGAINAARRGPDGRWQGDNFDGAGCVRALAEREVADPLFLNTCYSLLAPEYGISINAAYLADDQGIVSLLGSGGTSPLDAPESVRRDEAKYAEGWYASMIGEMFG